MSIGDGLRASHDKVENKMFDPDEKQTNVSSIRSFESMPFILLLKQHFAHLRRHFTFNNVANDETYSIPFSSARLPANTFLYLSHFLQPQLELIQLKANH